MVLKQRVLLVFMLFGSGLFAQSNKAKIAFNDALDHHRSRDYITAIGYLKNAIEASPDFQEAYRLLADCYDELNRAPEAIEAYEKVLTMNPNQDKVLYNLARLYVSEKKYQDAERCLQTAVDINPGYLRAQQKLDQLRQFMTENNIATTQPAKPAAASTYADAPIEPESEKFTPPSFDDKPAPQPEPLREEPAAPVEPTVGVKSDKLSQDDLMIFWADPDPGEVDFKSYSVSENFVDVKLKTVSNENLKPGQFKVYINGVAQQGARPEGEQVSAAVAGANGQVSQSYKNRIYLNPGINKIEVKVQTETGEVISQTMTVNYTPDLPNLHVLAIGPKHDDLAYTVNDAEDFAAAFGQQGGLLFKKVNVTRLTGKENASDNNIRKAMIDLLLKFQSGEIAERDVLVLFVSSHGKSIKGKFKILPSNYDKKYEEIYTIDFQDDILNVLNKVNCKKLIFVDACHSGAADDRGSKSGDDKKALSNALSDLLKIASGTSTISSCQRDQLSYEDLTWKNGAFTEAITEAFANKNCEDERGFYSSDTNGNGILTLGELYVFLKRRVPELVVEQKPNAPTKQMPLMTIGQLDDNTPVYVIKK
jgi:hypothetical protein